MLRGPFDDHISDPNGGISLDDTKGSYPDNQFPTVIDRMEMGGKGPDEKHPDDNPIEF